jgi:LPS-assembly protein
MLKSRFLTGFTAVILVFSLRALAETQSETELLTSDTASPSTPSSSEVTSDSIVVDGDKLEMHLDKQMHVIGNASISRGKQTILGDDINYDVQNDALHATGHVRIELGDASVTGPELQMQLSDNIGEIRDASIAINKANALQLKQRSQESDNWQNQEIGRDASFSAPRRSANNFATQIYDTSANVTSDNFTTDSETSSATHLPPQSRADAKNIFLEGQNKKRLKEARYTTCPAGVDDWYIKAKELALNDFTETGVGKNAYIEFKKVPILYTPWISFSYSGQRKSGLLAPSFGTSSKTGLDVSVPFYWNIAPNMDAIITAREMSKRGIQLQGNFRYLEETFSGKDDLEYLPNDSQSNKARYYASLKHQQILGNGWSAGYSLEKVSDNQYFSELSTRIITTSRIILPQQFNVDYNDETWHFNALAQKFQTLDNATYPYERLPQLTLSGNQYFGDVNANLYTQFVAFDANKNAPAIPTGNRYTLYPSISLPMSRPYGYITPKLGIHYSNYTLNNVASNLESQQRTLPILSIDSGLYFDRDFKMANRGYSQTLEPRLFYVYIPYKNQSNIPLFDTGEADLNFGTMFRENRFTGNDLVNDANQVSLALTTRLIETDTGIQRLSASIGQRYYFSNQKVALPGTTLSQSNSSDIIAGLSANLRSSWRVDTFWQYNTESANGVRTTISSRYNPDPGKTLNLSYSYRRDLTGAAVSSGINQFDISGQWPLSPGWYGVGRINYSLQEKQIIESLAGIEYNAGCWQARSVIQRVSTATAQANYALFFQLELGGIASIGTNPLSIIRRSIPGYTSTGLASDTY